MTFLWIKVMHSCCCVQIEVAEGKIQGLFWVSPEVCIPLEILVTCTHIAQLTGLKWLTFRHVFFFNLVNPRNKTVFCFLTGLLNPQQLLWSTKPLWCRLVEDAITLFAACRQDYCSDTSATCDEMLWWILPVALIVGDKPRPTPAACVRIFVGFPYHHWSFISGLVQ